MFKCTKSGCQVEFAVMWGFVWALYPERSMSFAIRGPNHTVRHRAGQYHDYPCEPGINGQRSLYDILRQENQKAGRIFQNQVAKVKNFEECVSQCIQRVVAALPEVEGGMLIELGSPILEIHDLPKFEQFHSLDEHLQYETSVSKLNEVIWPTRQYLELAVEKMAKIRLLTSSLHRQRLGKNRNCLWLVMSFLGRQEFLQPLDESIRSMNRSFGISATFKCKQVPAPVTVQEVIHEEPAAAVDEEVAASNMHVKQADAAAALELTNQVPEQADLLTMDKVNLLVYNRHPECFHEALRSGPALQGCRQALVDNGKKWELKNGAKVFVHPHQYDQVAINVFAEYAGALRPYHVIVAESLEYHVEACLNDLSHRQRPRVKESKPIATGSDETLQVGEVKRTFLCEVRRYRKPGSVTQSTTEAHSGGLNPRRAILPSAASD